MKARESNLPPSEDELLDLLVDDELDEAQRRTLLTALEQKPDGWRRCALAFLESQCLRRELRGVTPAKGKQPAPVPESRPAPIALISPRAPRGRRSWSTTVLAMAASFLVALGLSYEFRFGGSSNSSLTPDSTSLTQAGTMAGRGSSSDDPWGVVTLTGSDPSGVPQAVRLPAREKRQLDPSWWQGGAAAMPPEVVQALKDSGHEIQQSRQLMPVPLRDGRKLVVPVDQVDVHNVGNSQYQ